MQELIKIENVEGKETVNARNLHSFLESKQDFSTWIKSRIETYDFTEDTDYIKFHKKMEREIGATQRIEYYLSIEMAKELSMVERNEKGKEARQYFIECERVAKNQMVVLSPAEMVLQQAQLMVEQEKRINNIESKVKQIEAKQITIDESYFTVSGYCSLHNLQFDSKQSAELGRKCSKLSRENEHKINKIYDAKYGSVNSYHTSILEEVIC